MSRKLARILLLILLVFTIACCVGSAMTQPDATKDATKTATKSAPPTTPLVINTEQEKERNITLHFVDAETNELLFEYIGPVIEQTKDGVTTITIKEYPRLY